MTIQGRIGQAAQEQEKKLQRAKKSVSRQLQRVDSEERAQVEAQSSLEVQKETVSKLMEVCDSCKWSCSAHCWCTARDDSRQAEWERIQARHNDPEETKF